MHNDDSPGQRARRPTSKPRRLDETWIAIQGLTFLAGDHEAASRFFALSGLDAGTLRVAAAEPGFATAMLDYLVQDEALLVRFAAGAGCDPADIAFTYEVLMAHERRYTGES